LFVVIMFSISIGW